MPMLNIKIHRCNQKEPAWPDLKAEKELEFKNATIIEQGTTSGGGAVMFTIADPENGKLYVAQTSVDILTMLMGAIKGAEENWADNPVENVWKK